jgi:adenylyl cyclase-associated protein
MADPTKPLSDLLAQFSSRLSAVESSLGLEGGAAPVTGSTAPAPAAAAAGGDSPRIVAYDAYITAHLEPFVAAATALNPACEELGDITRRAFAAQRDFLVMATQSKKPTNGASLDTAKIMPFLKDLQGAFRDCGASATPDPNHQKTVNEGLQALQWLLMEPTPMEYVKEMIGASDFWGNKIRMQHKNTDGGEPHIAFVTTFKNLLNELVNYIKAHHTTGVTYNPQGGDVSAASVAPAPAPAAAKPAAKAGSGGGLADVFAGIKSIDQSSGKTAGLKAVSKDQQTWRKEYAGGDKPAPVKKAPVKRKEEKPTKPAVCELQRDKWVVEYQSSDQGVCEVAMASVKQQAYIYGCIGATINVTGKCKSIVVDSCKKTKVLFDSAISSCELVNCQRMQIQVRGSVPSIAIDKTDGCLTYLSSESKQVTQFVTSKSSEMNVSFPDAAGEMVETPIPEQFVHKVQDNGQMSSDVSELYSA